MSEEFKFDGLYAEVDREPIFVSFVGEQGIGKTHVALTFPNASVADTEGRAVIPMKKYKNDRRKIIGDWDDLSNAANWFLDTQKVGSTFIIDSASDIRHLAENQYLAETGKAKVYPNVCWAQVDERPKNLIKALRAYGMNVVFTQRIKEKYDKEGNSTGEFAPEGWNRIQYFSDVVIWLEYGIKYNGMLYAPDVLVGRVLDNKWHPKGKSKSHLVDLSYDGIFKELKPKWTGTMEDVIKEVQSKSEYQPQKLEVENTEEREN